MEAPAKPRRACRERDRDHRGAGRASTVGAASGRGSTGSNGTTFPASQRTAEILAAKITGANRMRHQGNAIEDDRPKPSDAWASCPHRVLSLLRALGCSADDLRALPTSPFL